MQTSRRIIPLLLSLVFLASGLAHAEGYRTIALPKGCKVRDRIQDKIMARKIVRPMSQAARTRLAGGEANLAAKAQGRATLKSLYSLSKGSAVKRGMRRGYGSRDIEFKGSGLAKKLGLKKGQSVQWNTRGAAYDLKVESHSRVVLTLRRHDRYMGALRSSVVRVVEKIAAEPSRALTDRDQRVLATAPTDMRAEALAKHGLKLERVKSGTEGNLKYKLHVPAAKLSLYNKVFGPGVSAYMPGKGHSMYVHKGLVWETFPYHGSSKLRPTSRTIYPVMLSNSESRRMDVLAASLKEGYRGEGSQGGLKATGRPANWPIKPGDSATGNTCTTTHHRAPVGQRAPELAWMGKLERSISKLAAKGALNDMKLFMPKGLESWKQKLLHIKAPSNPLLDKPLLRVLTQTEPRQRIELLDQLATRPGITAEDRANIGKLKPWVELYNKKLPSFPLELMGRTQLKSVMGVPHDPKRLGTTDPLGPGYAMGLYSKAPHRIPVLVKLEKN
jgi:hypothetical protein